MSLEDRFDEAPESHHHTTCVTCAWYSQLDDEDKAFFDKKARVFFGEPRAGCRRLWESCCASDPDGKREPLKVGSRAFREHLQRHHPHGAKGDGESVGPG